jgi:hypothetical protein
MCLRRACIEKARERNKTMEKKCIMRSFITALFAKNYEVDKMGGTCMQLYSL